MKVIYFFVLMLSLFLTGCSVFSPIKNDPPTSYVLNSVPTVAKKSRHNVTLLVAQPETNSVYNSTGMAYTLQPYQVAYFAKSQWADTPGRMLHPLLVQTLQNTGYFKAVLSSPFIGQSNYMLNTEVQQLQQDYSHTPATLSLTVKAQLVNVTTNRIVAVKQFTVTEPIPQNSPYGGVVAANHATNQTLSKIAGFVVSSL